MLQSEPTPLILQEISLYQELLVCLEQEAQALGAAQEETILSLAVSKEDILERLLGVKKARAEEPAAPGSQTLQKDLARLERKVATLNLRNREIISASLEVIDEFISQFHPPGPGLYRPEGRVEQGSGRALFHRQA
ncbi:MAG: flagellar export chaperone FlgN [Desulfobaccales bacterium]